MDASAWAAWYAAGVATLIGVWDIYKWASDGPKLRASAHPDMLVSGEEASGKKYIRVTVANTGSKPTTLNSLGLFVFANRWKRLRMRPEKAFVVARISFSARALPFQLQTGTQWDGCLDQDDELVAMAKEHELYVAFYFSHSEKPLLKQIIFRGRA